MMLSAADFAELFPPLNHPDADRANGPSSLPSEACLTRWQDDGGRSHRPPSRPNESAIPVRVGAYTGYGMASPGSVGTALAFMPAIAMFGAATAVLATIDDLNRT